MASSRASSPTTRSSISSPTTTITSRKPTSRAPTPISRRNPTINEQIDRMRHSATRALLERDDVIIVASVSCIYGIGSVETYTAMTFSMKLGDKVDQRQLIADLVALQYKRVQAGDFSRGTVPRARRHDRSLPRPLRGPRLAHRLVRRRDRVDRRVRSADRQVKTQDLEFVKVYANSHYVTPRPTLLQSIKGIKDELQARLDRAPRARPPARSAAARAAHHVRPRNAGGDRLLRRHRELFALSHRPQARRAAADLVRISARQRARLHRREPRHHPADRRHVSRRLSGARRRSPNTASACPPAWTTARCASRNGTRCGRRPCMSRRRPANGRWSRPAASSSSR